MTQNLLQGLLNCFTYLGMPIAIELPDHIQRQLSFSIVTKPLLIDYLQTINRQRTYFRFIESH